jgi:two-component sensor histidine kinase
VAASLSGQRVSLSIQDNGASMPESVGFDETTGFGLMLVKMLVDQLSGTIGIDRREGTRIFLEFPI